MEKHTFPTLASLIQQNGKFVSFIISNCVRCLQTEKLEKIVFGRYVKLICYNCGEICDFSLPKLNKKIIYLDQNIFSEAFKGVKNKSTEKFLKIFSRLKVLAKKQAIICPYSHVHDFESHLAGEMANALYEFIKTTSRNKSFYGSFRIKRQQLINAFSLFKEKTPINHKLYLDDALSSEIHDWDSTFIINNNWTITRLISSDTTRKEKEDFMKAFINALPFWRISNNSLVEDYKIEINESASILWDSLVNFDISSGIDKIIQNENFSMMSILLDIGTGTLEEKLLNIHEFLNSRYFENIPHVNISSGLWAIIKQKIKNKQFLVTDKIKKIKKNIKGLSFDIQHLSVFAPYCDAIFFENTMARYFQEIREKNLSDFNCKIFSIDKFKEFEDYLDDIEYSISSTVLEAYKMLYK